ncbi:peroxide stress protein YaaA [Catenulispora yoronensis]
MLILLPPSEGKAAHGARPAVDPAALAFPQLAKTRKALLTELARVSKGRAATALTVLGLSPNQAGELEANRDLTTAPTLAAADRYTGVLYDNLDLPGLRADDPEAYARAEARILTFSGLWGVVRPGDAIPAYRLSGGVTLPKAGPVAKVWRQALTPALAPAVASGLVVDLRSSTYAAMWRVPADAADRAVTVRVLHERLVDGVPKRSVVSHFNKAAKGRLARALLVGDVAATTPKELAEALQDLGFRTETTAPAKPGTAWTIDVVVDSVV